MTVTAFEPCAKWEPDCQGKWDYDGRLISISTRYWSGRGMDIFDTGTGEWTQGPLSKPSATASIVLNHGAPDEYGYGDSTDIMSQEFEGETEAEVKAAVEAWVKARVQDVAAAVFALSDSAGRRPVGAECEAAQSGP